MGDTDRLRRLRQARLTGRVPRDLIPWLLEIAGEAETTAPIEPRTSPAERLMDDLGDEIDRWMTSRGATQRSIAVSRRTLSRALRGDNVTLETVAEIASALNCDVEIRFHERGGDGATDGATSGRDGSTAQGGRTMDTRGTAAHDDPTTT